MHSKVRRSGLPGGFVVLLFTSCFLTLVGALAPFSPIGIPAPQAIGPYLNGVFPQETPGNGAGDNNWTLVNAYPNLLFTDPLSIIQLPDTSGFYVTGKPGYVWKIANDSTTSVKNTVLDISSVVHTDGDAGLINMILHPEFGQAGSPNRGYAYFIYRYHPQGDAIGDCDADAYTRLSRFTRPDGQEQFDPNSELVLIQQVDPHCWHTGGGMFFDDEGYFYFTFGDAGSSNDPFHTSQQIDSFFFGGLHRIDVDKIASRSHPIIRQPKDRPHSLPENSYSQGYYIPNDNPWVNPDGSVLEEFFALGLRSPHRASFDPVTRQIWVAEVGEGSREEINLVEKGDNLQWSFLEGSLDGPHTQPVPLIGNSKGPVYEYSHSEGTAIIGGFVYRGESFNGALDGKYIFGDHGTRHIWTYNLNTHEVDYLATVPSGGVGNKNGISSFGTDFVGNVYVLKLYETDMDGGAIYKLHPAIDVPDPPSLLSQTGAFSDLTTLTPAPGLIPYTVNAPLWSDAAVKKRWVAIPNNGSYNTAAEQVVFSETSSWQFPPGTVFIKHFELPVDINNPDSTVRLETRFIVIKADGTEYGVTYKWNAQGTDAQLLTTSDTASFEILEKDLSVRKQIWNFPSRTDCQTCHNDNAGAVLGVRTWQMNGDYTYPSTITDNQLNTWLALGIFANPFSPSDIPAFLKSAAIQDETVDLETRVRSYLDANCAHCHQPNGVNGAFDARFSTPLQDQQLVYSLGVSVNTSPGSFIIKPKDHLWSELWVRDNKLGNGAMPPLAKNLIDTAYIRVLTDWISELDDTTCYIFHLSDLDPVSSVNGWGPVEFDQSNGSTDPEDGTTMTINGVTYAKGLGVHAESEIIYDLNGQYQFFRTSIGLDDAKDDCENASVQFFIYLDNVLTYQSPVMDRNDDAIDLEIDVSGRNQLKLVVGDAGDGINCDHADWANARLVKGCDDGDPCTENDGFDKDCNCAGTLIDHNQDGVCDSLNFQVAAKIYLEGPFLNPFPGEEFLMKDHLRTQGLIPSLSPYPDSLICSDTVFLITGANAVTDWVWIELRDPQDSTLVIDSSSALLQRDGDLVAVDGISPVTFKTGKGQYYVVIKHRNHLGIMTKNALPLGFVSPTSLDFTSNDMETFGTNIRKMINGLWTLPAGDTNGDGIVNAADRSTTWNERNSLGYRASDCSLSGATEASDRSITWNNRNLFSQIPK